LSVSPVDAVRALIDRYERGVLDFESLVADVMHRWRAREGTERGVVGWPEVYRRCEEVPDDDDVFWVSMAEDRGSLTVEQSDQLFTALGGLSGDHD